MKISKTVIMKLTGICLILAAAFMITACVPRQAYAAKKTTYMFDSSSTKAKMSSYKATKFKLCGAPYNTADYKQRLKGWYTFKVNSKTKYKTVVNTETGKTKKLSKKSALKKLKKKNYIAVYITFKSGKTNTVTQILFGV